MARARGELGSSNILGIEVQWVKSGSSKGGQEWPLVPQESSPSASMQV